jgi:hypothetical protein
MTTLRLSGSSPNAAGILTGSLSKFTSGEWVTQLSGFGTSLLPLGGGVRLGVSAGIDANRIEGVSWNGQTSVGVLGVLGSRATLVTAGASVGAAMTVYDTTVNTTVLNARVQQGVGRGVALSGGISTVSSDTIDYADLTVEMTYSGEKLRASVGLGTRAGDLEDDPWGHAHIEYELMPRLSYEVTLGRYPQSLVGFTDGLYLTSGVRVRITRSSRYERASVLPVEIEVLDSNRARITLKYSGDAESLEIVGAWNGWLPVRLEQTGDELWTTVLSLEPGIYQYAIVVNGTVWTVPDGVPAEPDDFGGKVATLVVSADERTRR